MSSGTAPRSIPGAGVPSAHTLYARAGPSELDAAVVFWVDILLICVVGLLFFLTIPRALAFVSRSGAWADGVILRGRGNSLNSLIRAGDEGESVSSSQRQIVSGDASPQLSTERDSNGLEANEKTSRSHFRTPRHVPSLPTLFPRLVQVFRTPVIGHVNLGGIVICVLYFALLLFAALYRTSIWTNPTRAGWVAISQIPVVYLLATKNNVLGVMLGVAYGKLNYLHRFAGRLLVLAGNVHAIGMIYKFTMEGKWTQIIAHSAITWGLVSLILLDILFLFSLEIFRRRFYNLFIVTHFIAGIVFLAAVCLHMSAAVPYVAAAAAFYGLDRVLRLLKSRISTATLTCLPELHMTQVYIPTLAGGWRAGQHVRLRVLSSGMGPYAWAEAHPYTIASASASAGKCASQEGVVLLCKTTGRWSRRLYEIAEEDRRGSGLGSEVKVLIEGPYGGLGYMMSNSSSGAMFFVGGSGISYGLAGVQELLLQAQTGRSSARAVDLVWAVHHPDCVRPVLPLLSSLLSQGQAVGVELRISVFYTRAVTPAHACDDLVLPLGLSLEPGRPHVRKILRDAADRMSADPQAAKEQRGIFVGVCGPTSLGDGVRNAVGDADVISAARGVGGIELHEEIFSL